jgi:hypothetical protein
LPNSCIILLPPPAKATIREQMLVQATILHVLVYKQGLSFVVGPAYNL